jgi:hypothetical protein
MKSLYQFGFAFALLVLMNLVPAHAFASRNAGMGRTHTQTYHDRTPTVHTHGSHPHHG